MLGIWAPYRFHEVRSAALNGIRHQVGEQQLWFHEALAPTLRPGAIPQAMAWGLNQRVPSVSRPDPACAVREASRTGHTVLTEDSLVVR